MDIYNYFIYSNFDFSKKSAGATRMLYYAKALANENNKVFMVSCCKSDIDTQSFEEIEPHIFILQRKKLTRNFFKSILFLIRLFNFSKRSKGRHIFIFYPSPLFFLEVLALIYLKGIKKQNVYYELNEVRLHSSAFHEPLSIKKPLYSLKKITFKSVFFLMQYLLYFYTGIICISTSIEKYAKKYNQKTIRIPILTDPYIKIDKKYIKTYSKEGYFNIGFSGTIHLSKENLLNFIENLEKLNKYSFKVIFNLCGPISEKDYKKLFADNTYKVKLNYFGNLNQVELSEFLIQQNLLVIPRGDTLQNRFGFSTKLSDYLNHKKVILLTDISDNSLYIKDGVNGYIVPPDNNKVMFEKLVYIIKSFKENEMSIIENAYSTSKENFYYKNYSKEFQFFFNSTKF